jgi:RHS repeat-associated protein
VNNVDIAKEYVFGYDLLSQNTAAIVDDSVDGAVEGADSGETQTDTVFYHYDSLGTTRNLSNDSGVITDDYFYEAFGDLLASTGTTDNDYLYTGEQYDAALDNYYLRARYYNQGVGRFTQQDTWMGREINPITLNKYLYGHSEPLNGIDQSGNMFITDSTMASSIQGSLQGGRAVGFRLTLKRVGKELACVTIKEIAINKIAEMAIGVYVFTDGDNDNKPYAGKTNNHKVRKKQHGKRVKEMLVQVEFRAKNILDLFGLSDENKALDNGLRIVEQSFMDYFDGNEIQTSNKYNSVANNPKSLNSQKIRTILNNGINICEDK